VQAPFEPASILDARGVKDQPIKTFGMERVPTVPMRSFMEQCAQFGKYDSRAKAWNPCKPPEDVAELILAPWLLAVPASARRASGTLAAPGRIDHRGGRLRCRHRDVPHRPAANTGHPRTTDHGMASA
jgi:hypothetical protein